MAIKDAVSFAGAAADNVEEIHRVKLRAVLANANTARCASRLRILFFGRNDLAKASLIAARRLRPEFDAVANCVFAGSADC
jgi:hypothetical protein